MPEELSDGSVLPEQAAWSPGSLERLGDRVWLVLGGGGLRGLAHVGVWKAIEESGLRVAGIVGTSIGALVGACIAGGMHYPELVRLAFRLRRSDLARVNRRALLFNGIRQESLFLREPLQEYLERVLPATHWDDLEMPLQVNAVDLETGETTWFGTGADTGPAMVDALYASAALPVFYPPARIDGRVYVDGGVEWALPLHRSAELGATGIVGVDVGSAARPSSDAVAGGMLAIHQRVFSLMNWRKRADLVAHWDEPPLLFVRPRMDGYGTFAFEEVRYFIEEGYRSTRAALVAGV